MCCWREHADDAWVIQSVQQSAPLLEQVLSQPITVRVSSRFHADNPETVCQAAVVGLGIALLPGYVCTEALRSKKLVRILREWTPVTRFGTHISAVATPDRMRMARVRAMVAYLRSKSTQHAFR